jgi:Host cell surface-exposed lipoprotein
VQAVVNSTGTVHQDEVLQLNVAMDCATVSVGKAPPAQGFGTPAPTASSPAAPAPASSAPAQQAPAQQAPASQPATAPAGPTVSQQQALESAQSYLDLGTGFSRAGLIAQLDSPYGGKFSVADATWAADHSGADWDAQAVLAAKGYMQLGGFSRASLIDQLDSPYGGQFTLAQATYAANQVGL